MQAIPEGFDYNKPHCKYTAMYLRHKFTIVKDGYVFADPENTNIWKIFPSKREIILMEGYRCKDTDFFMQQMVFWGWRIIDRT
jgi:hypothetical protein